jgi:choline dehydrogenase-like flavoprotein
MATSSGKRYDAVVIGSGFGGSLAAQALLDRGQRVVLLERGGWVGRGPHNWGEEGAFVLTPHYSSESACEVRAGLRWRPQPLCTCVGGPSVFYGGASFRYRQEDFSPPAEIVGDSAAAWPFDYAELEPYYRRAEELLGVAGAAGVDPTEPGRSEPFPRSPIALAAVSRRIAEAASGLGMRPFRIPMAIDGERCRACTTCDAYACAVSAKNDLATRLLPVLMERGLELRAETVAVRLVARQGRVTHVEAFDRATGRVESIAAEAFVLAGGALASPHLVLASGLAARSPAAAAIGRYLMRHCNAMVYGYFPQRPNPAGEHHKQIAIHDYYFGDAAAPGLGKLGGIQQVMAPPPGLLRGMLPRPLAWPAAAMAEHLTGLLVIAEDQPRATNRVEIDRGVTDRFGLPRLRIHHRYSRRDLAARRALARRAREVLKMAGARFCLTWNVTTFSHALGTLRMGLDPSTSPLDGGGAFRGLDNLWISDASALPTSAGVNPSLTIAANALRIAEGIGRS